MSRFWSHCQALLTILALVALCAVLPPGCSHSSPAESSGQPASSSNVLVNGRAITPAGTTSGPVGDMPLNIVVSPDGKYAVTTSSGLNALLCTLKVSDGTLVSSVSYPTLDPDSPNNGLFYGLVFDPTPINDSYRASELGSGL